MRNNGISYLLKNVGIFTISNFSTKIMVFFLVPLYTRILSPNEFGIFDLALTTIQLIVPIFTFNITDAVMRFSMDKDVKKNEMATIGIRYILLSLIPCSIFLFFIPKISMFKEFMGYRIIIFLYYFVYIVNQFFSQFSKGLEKIKDLGISGVLETAVLLSLNLLFLLKFKWGLKGYFLANIISLLIGIVYLFIRLKFHRYINLRCKNKELRQNMLSYSIPLILSVIGWWVNNASDKYVVTFFCGTSAMGILAVAYKIPGMLNTFQTIFIQAWQVSAIKEFDKKNKNEFYGSLFSVLNCVMCLIGAILILLTRPLSNFLFGNSFYISWKYVPFLILSSIINSSSGFLGPVLSAKKDSKNMALSAFWGALINLILNIFLVILIGVQGVTIATVISSCVIFYVRKRATSQEVNLLRIKKDLFCWGLICLESIFEIYNINFIFLILIIITIIILNIKELNMIINFFFHNAVTKQKIK